MIENKFASRLLRKASVLMMLIALLVFGAAIAVAQADLTGVEWQLIRMTDAATGETITISDPSQYTLTFNTDGTVSGQADCNRHAGSFTQGNGDLDIVLALATTALCEDGSLEFAFRDALDNAVSGAVNSDGNLVLETEGGAQELVFRSGAGAAAAAGATTSGGWLGLPWLLWLLLGLLLLALLWWLFGRRPAPTPEPVVTRPATPDPVVTRAATVEPLAQPVPDDLTVIEGIGPKINSILHNAGILTFLGLSEASVDRLRDILAAAELRGAFGDPSTWPAQAKLAAEGKWDELEALQESLKGGRVE